MNYKHLWTIGILLLTWTPFIQAQDYTTRKGKVEFRSSTSEESIEAINNDAAAILKSSDGTGKFIIPIKSFKFQKALMQEHFNENYMESDKYTKATYNYKITNWSSVSLNKPGVHKVKTEGEMTIKNTTKSIQVSGTVTVVDDKTLLIEADFTVQPKDYGISIPGVVKSKISESIKIKVKSNLQK